MAAPLNDELDSSNHHTTRREIWKKEILGRVVAVETLTGNINNQKRYEIEKIKKLSHIHIVRLSFEAESRPPRPPPPSWSYTDLATVLDDMNRRLSPSDQTGSEDHSVAGRSKHSKQLGTLSDGKVRHYKSHLGYLRCITRAIEYLHSNNIQHQNLTPANILLGQDNHLWVAGIGTVVSSSGANDNGLRGTLRYRAPEATNRSIRHGGASADIFSLGCIFLEMLALCNNISLEEQEMQIRKAKDHSFQGNIDDINRWFDDWEKYTMGDECLHLLTEVRMMLRKRSKSRPSASQVARTIDIILPPAASCCGFSSTAALSPHSDPLQITLTYGNTYDSYADTEDEKRNRWCFFVECDENLVNINETRFFLHPSFREPQRVRTESPFDVYSECKNPILIKVAVFLKHPVYWRRSKEGSRENYQPPSEPIILERQLTLTANAKPTSVQLDVLSNFS